MRVAFRADASHDIGTGHVMRCLTLAEGLQGRGADIRFVSRHLPEGLEGMVKAMGFGFRRLAPGISVGPLGGLAHASWLGTSQEADARQTLQALSDQAWDWVVVDHYALDRQWETPLRQVARRILAIDDLADRPHDCDLLLDQNLYGDMDTRYAGKVPHQARLLLGPRYALLRQAFRDLRPAARPRQGPVGRILVFFGGVDAPNLTGRAIQALAALGHPGLQVDVVIGSQHPCRAEIAAECLALGYRCHVQTDRMADLMREADLALGASGSASWERCCLGLPACLVTMAENQVAIARGLDEAGAAIWLGDLETCTEAVLRRQLLGLFDQRERLAAVSQAAFDLVDGEGLDRICDLMVGAS